jgi:hypothetical protein
VWRNGGPDGRGSAEDFVVAAAMWGSAMSSELGKERRAPGTHERCNMRRKHTVLPYLGVLASKFTSTTSFQFSICERFC